MEEKNMEDLKQEADSLGLEYAGNISKAKLADKIDAYYDAESKSAVVEQDIEEVKPEKTTPKAGSKKTTEEIKAEAVVNAKKRMAESIKAGRETVVVKITMVDKREASSATSAYFNNGIDAMNIPLDQFVEIPKGLVAMAEDAKAVTHQDGADKAKLTKKYVVEYKK